MRRTETRRFFRPLCTDLVSLFRTLSPHDWERPTPVGSWRIRDIAAHMLDTTLRRLSFHRDGLSPGTPGAPPASEREFVAFINDLNAQWVKGAQRLSPRVLTDLYEHAAADLSAFVEQLPDDAPALFPVTWAGDRESPGWFDIGREFTEIWHHGAQIRDALGAGPFREPAWLRAVLEISMHALPHGYRDVPAADGAALAIQISGPSGGAWLLRRVSGRWMVEEGGGPATARVVLTDETAWRVLYNALPATAAGHRVHTEGDPLLAARFLHIRSVIV